MTQRFIESLHQHLHWKLALIHWEIIFRSSKSRSILSSPFIINIWFDYYYGFDYGIIVINLEALFSVEDIFIFPLTITVQASVFRKENS